MYYYVIFPFQFAFCQTPILIIYWPLSKVGICNLCCAVQIQVLTVGALHQIDFAALRVAASTWHDEFAPLPKPLLVVNIGGPTSNYSLYYES